MIEGIGGGTCQAASTFHAAAYLAGLDVLERLPHSRPSAYIAMGLDATVVYPSVDLKVRNPWPFPVVVHAAVGADTVAVEMLGRERVADVTFGRMVVASRPYARRVVELPGLAEDRIVRKQRGIRGYTVQRRRTVTLLDGTARIDESRDVYPPTAEIFLLPPGVDADAALPPLLETLEPEAGTPAPAAAAASCVDCERPRIVEAPGVHAPTPEQAHPAYNAVFRGGR
jgi:hypothetical protein